MRNAATVLAVACLWLGAAIPTAWTQEDAIPLPPRMGAGAPRVNPYAREAVDPAAPVPAPTRANGGAIAEDPLAGTPAEVLDPTPLSLDELRQIALDNNPTLVQARMAVQAARGQQVQAGVYLNPEFSWMGVDQGLEGTSGQQGGYITQEFITAHKRRLAQNVAGHGVLAAEQAFAAQRWRVLNDVRWGFYQALIAQRMVEVNEQLVAIGDTAQQTTQRLRALQEVSEADVLQATIEAEQARLGLFQARNRQHTSWYQLIAQAGVPDMPPRKLMGDATEGLPQITWDDGLVRLLALSPELAEAQARVEQARCNVALQQAMSRANVALQVGVKYDEPARDTLTDVAVSMPLMIFDRNQGNRMSAYAELNAANRELRRIELDLRNRFADGYENYSNARQALHVYCSTILASAQNSLELTAAGYRAGEYSYLQLLTAQRTNFTVNLEYLSTLQSLWSHAISLEGFLLSGGLEPLP